jgi:hypothetical protein
MPAPVINQVKKLSVELHKLLSKPKITPINLKKTQDVAWGFFVLFPYLISERKFYENAQ